MTFARLACLAALFAPALPALARSPAGEQGSADRHVRKVTFELTFANRDVVWQGDPASPTSSLSIQPGARPVATDVCVVTTTESWSTPHRRYLAARIAGDNPRVVYAFTNLAERRIGIVDPQGQFQPEPPYSELRKTLLPDWPADVRELHYDSDRQALYLELSQSGPVISESLDFLPLELCTTQGEPAAGRYRVDYSPDDAEAVLRLELGEHSTIVARAALPTRLQRSEVQLGSFDNTQQHYLPESAYRPGRPAPAGAGPAVTLTLAGEFTSSIDAEGAALTYRADWPTAPLARGAPAPISVDGHFEDWRNVRGVDDPRGDVVPYLDYVPDVDLLEFKVSHDDAHLYLYARVAGRVGYCHPRRGRSYFYAYLDVDQNAGTGFLPTRDDNCYYGVDLGDDCEVQFEFVNGRFRKSFYGFCGLGGDPEVLHRRVTIGPSQYGRENPDGSERTHYKSEYTFRNGATEITEDLQHGSSDSIHLAISPDGSEVEIASSYAGFLQDPQGRATVAPGQTIDLAAGMEADGRAYGKSRWGADSTPIIRGYELRPAEGGAQDR